MITICNLIISLSILSIISCTESYRILGIFPHNGKSHSVMFKALMKGLAERGHQVDDVTHFPANNAPPNYKVVLNLNGTVKSIENSFTIDFGKTLGGRSAVEVVATNFGNDLCQLLARDDLQQFIKQLPTADPPYDVVITEVFGANCYMGIGHLLKVPVITLSSAAEYPWINHLLRNYDNLAVNPHILLSSFDQNNFWDRLYNLVTYYWNVYVFNTISKDVQTELMRKYISPDIPDIREVEKNIALTIVNRDPLIYGAKAITSSLIEASGLHIEGNNDVLNEMLKKWLDNSEHGVVYFSLGTFVQIETFHIDTIKEIYESVAKLAPTRVLIKIVDKSKLPPGLPKNVLTLPWIPQQAVLAHKNIRAFVTHGGLMGTQEAVYHGVPMIGIPLFGDQGRNVASFVAKKVAVKLELDNITTASLDEALNTVLKNPEYRKSAKIYSKVFRDRPLSAMDTATFWIEYVIRNGPEVLRPPGLELSWWQTACIDIYAFIFLNVCTVVALLFYITKTLLCKCIFSRTKKTTVKSKSKLQ